MYEDTVLPVRNKFRIQSESKIRIYFVQEETKRSLSVLKWLELVSHDNRVYFEVFNEKSVQNSLI